MGETLQRKLDILIIGGGAVGCAVARELSRFSLHVALVEKACDVASGASGRNSAVVHAGFNNPPGSLAAQLCVEGNRGFSALCRQLDVPYQKTGKLLVAFDAADWAVLTQLKQQGEQHGCQGLTLISQQELTSRLPQIHGIGALLSPETAIFDPFLYTIALAENAAANGVKFYFNCPVTRISREAEGFSVLAGAQRFSTRRIINCAGLFSDQISTLAGVPGYRLYPCKGEYFILDRLPQTRLPMPVYPAPRKGSGGLGVHLTPTVHGNLLLGPSAEYLDDRTDYASTHPVMQTLFRQAQQLMPSLEKSHIIGSYCGIRPKQTPPGQGGYADFVIQEEARCPGLINLIGIESPGMTASAPIAGRVRDLLARTLPLQLREDFIPEHRSILRFRECSPSEQAKLIALDPDYGEIFCRCQTITKKEVRQAIENPLGVTSIAGIKYRAWVTTGRCHGGYCLPKIAQLLGEEYGLSPEEITYRGQGSPLFVGRMRE